MLVTGKAVEFNGWTELSPFPVLGNVKVAGFNTLNWFTTLGSRGANTAEEQQRQLAKLVAALKGMNADAVGLMEVQNNGQTAVQALVDALNAEMGAGTYAALRHPTEYNPPGLYRPDAFRSSDHDPVVIGLTLPGGRS
ncbi:putative extracellular nuclease [Streptosporangium album]|uniref:Putative extracellular nuclease n=1 Tax=Streptosporangium album TaxID=47479 RepID=A0A7W7WDH6_9ACTN|nr:hypothetical protein [Streptosporangium album]MBB4943722.1 putative extracellular nuclease [Streptosporangium album]